MTALPADIVELSPAVEPATRQRRGVPQLVAHQVKFDLLSLVRNGQARFFTIAMPVGFLLLFCAIFGNGSIKADGESVRASTYYVANLTTFGIVDAACMSLAIALVDARETGIIRRRQATPQPSWIIVVGRAVTTILTATVTGVVLLAIGRLAFGASTPLAGLPSLAASVVIGSTAFCCIGFALTGFIRSIQSAQPVVMGATMPLFFISGVFIPWAIIPHWLQHVAAIFPIRHLSLAILAPFVSHGGHGTWSRDDLLVLVAWGVGGLALALRSFKWAPQDT
jgi:ABC-2 type transport system permease protein